MTSHLPQAILLDLDDTILAFDSVAEPCWRRVCLDFCTQLPGVSAGALHEAIRESRAHYWQDPERHRQGRLNLRAARQEVVAAALRRLGVDAPRLAAEIAAAYAQAREAAIHPLPGAIETVRDLRRRGVRLGLLTNGTGEEQRGKIDRFALAPLFDLILIEGEFGAGKPDARVYRHALQALGVEPAATWMVGDNLEWDVLAPQGLGITGIWVDAAGQGVPAGSPARPDRIVRSLNELVCTAEGDR